MLTPKEYLEQGFPESGEIWVNALDLVEHCLQGDYKQTFFKHAGPERRYFNEWSEAMQKRSEWDGEFNELFENSYQPRKSWSRYDDDSGDLMVDRWIAGEEFCFDAYECRSHQKPAISVIYSGSVNYGDRNKKYMEDRHKQVYAIAAQCEAERRPCRVIVEITIEIPEAKHSENKESTVKVFAVVKDYNDPIFPAIWGTFTTNAYTNSFANVLMDYFIGTADPGNGWPRALHHVRNYLPEDEEIITFGDVYDD